MNSQQAIERIRLGVARFQAEVFPGQRGRFETLAHRQDPIALFITCTDSRIVPNLITQTGPGELFVERNPGNLVPRHRDLVVNVSASLEYALLVLKVPLVIICGHTDCGVMKGLLRPETVERLPAIRQWMGHARGVREQVLGKYSDRAEQDQLFFITQQNILLQIENLKTYPSVQVRLDAGELEIHGWVYDIAAGACWSVNPALGRFEVLGAKDNP